MEEMMQAYQGFAGVYEELMDNVPYEMWAKRLIGLLQQDGIREGLVLELGCGTGIMTRLLAQAGYDMIGIDASEEMLSEAQERTEVREGEAPILYLCQDMREFELYGTVQAVVSVCDSLNYILEKEELVQVFRLVNNYLEAGGLFLFDMNMESRFQGIASACIAENRDRVSFIWNNEYDEAEKINEYELTLFLRGEDGRYEKRTEYHYERGYSVEEVFECLKEAGMEPVAAFHEYGEAKAGKESQRVLFVARESFQPGKTYANDLPASEKPAEK